MVIGNLRAKIILTEPKRVHQGPGAPVQGNIELEWLPAPASKGASIGAGNDELFGPLNATVSFQGRAKSKIWERHNNSTSIYRGRAPLFYNTILAYDDSIRLTKNGSMLIPFSICFPPGNETVATGGQWNEDPRYDVTPGAPLPPSMFIEYRGFAHHHLCFVEYRVSARITMPGLRVTVTGLEDDAGPRVNYEPLPLLIEPSPERHVLNRDAVIQNEFLLPEEDRPSGFREKAKAMLKSDYYPKFHFDISVSSPKDVILGQPLAFTCWVKPNFETSTAVVIPDITLHWLRATLSAKTAVRSERNVISCHESGSSEDVLRIQARDDSAPFGKAGDWTKVVQTQVVEGNFCSSFRTFNISHTYTLKLDLAVYCASKKITMEWELPVLVHPPAPPPLFVPGSGVDTAGRAAPSGMGGPSAPLVEDLGDVDRVAPLPEYEEPPGYDQVGGYAGRVPDVQGKGNC